VGSRASSLQYSLAAGLLQADNAIMAAKKPSPAMDLLVSALKSNPKATYADLKAKADAKSLKLYPIMFGRAQALLGIVKSAKRGSGKAAKATAAKKARAAGTGGGRKDDPSSKSGRIRALLSTGMSASEIAKKVGATTGLVYVVKSNMGTSKPAGKHGPGRPRKVAASTAVEGLDGILAAVKNSERERTELRAALEKIRGVIAGVLA
jgi:hypothetical protein